MTTLGTRRDLEMSTVDAAPDPTRLTHPARRRALLGVLFVGLCALMLRPGLDTIDHTYPDLGDSVFLTWSISWTGHALVTNPLHLFDANIFSPHALSLAYADSLVVLLPPFALIRALGGSWPLAMNLLTIGLVLLSLATTYSLTRWLTGRTDASVLAAIAYTFGAFSFEHLGHPQLMMLGAFPLAFLAVFRFLERPTMAAAALFGAMNVAMAMGSLYYVAIYGVCVAVILGGYLVARRFRPAAGFWRGVVVVMGVSLLAIPFLWPYYRLGLTRPLVPEAGLKLEDLVTPAQGSIFDGGLDAWAAGRDNRGEHTFFPGFATMALAAVGGVGLLLTTARRRRGASIAPAEPAEPTRRNDPGDRRPYLWFVVVTGAVAGIIALGPEVHGITMPFRYLHDNVPGFGGIRVPARLAVPGLLALAVLAGAGFATVTSRVRPVVATILAVGLGAFMLLELAAPIAHSELQTDAASLAVYHALTREPSGAVVELPVVDPTRQGGAAWASVEAPRMLYSTIDWKPRFNGYSGGWPPGYLEDAKVLNTFPSREAVATMRRLGVRYAVLHLGTFSRVPQYTTPEAGAIVARLPASAMATRHGNAWLVDLGKAR